MSIKSSTILLCSLFICITTAIASELPQITNIQNRSSYSLNGKWSYIIDQAEIGNKRKFWMDETPKNKTELLEYSFADAYKMNVPGDWNSQSDELLYYEGKIWYQKNFDFEVNADKRYFLYFGAVNYKAEVFLNGVKLGIHEGGFNPFVFEITEQLQNGSNSVVVSADNNREAEQIPTLLCDWKNFGGITRGVSIIEENKTFIRDFYVQLKKNESNEIEYWVQLDGEMDKQDVTINIPELKLSKTIKTDESGMAKGSYTVKNIDYWTPENPKLYNVTLEYDEVKLTDNIGFRTIQVKGTKILLNNEQIFLKGISLHEESPLTNGRANSIEEARMMLQWAKELNCNYVRLSHYPHNEHIVRLADEMGLLLWQEIPVYWDITWESEKTYDLSLQMLDDVITRDKNRAAVIIWSMANETDISEGRNVFLKNLIDYTRTKDNTRLISAALLVNEEESTKELKVVDDPFGENADIVSVNQYTGWYGSKQPDVLNNISWEIKFNKPFLFSEFGAGALHGFHADSLTRWSEEYQEWYYKKTLEMCDRIDQLQGISPWILIDFQSPRRRLRYFQDGYNRKGLISSEGEKKKAFYVLQEYYQKRK